MSEHLLTEDIKNYVSRKMKPADLLAADDHLAECDLCLIKIKALAKAQNSGDFDFLQVSPKDSEHLRYQQLENYIDEQSDDIDREIADVHLKVCAACKTELNGLIEMRKLIEATLQKQILLQKPAEKSIFVQIKNFFAAGYFLRFAVAACALLLFSALMFWFTKRDTPSEIAVTSLPSNPNLPVNLTANTSENIDVNTPQNTDANLRNQSPANNKTDEFPAIYQTEVRRVLTANRLNLPAELNELNGQKGKLMSGGDESIPFALARPLGRIIQTDRPQFKWRALEGANGYVVNVYDENFNPVAKSPQIAGTNWQSNRPLTRNRIYIWQVTALKNGEEIKSPVRPAPDAKFKVLDAARTNELARLSRQYKNEHLFLGILYANAGLLDEAAGEFQKEIGKNPNSKAARKFLQDVRKLK
jgi:hypothetical protein